MKLSLPEKPHSPKTRRLLVRIFLVLLAIVLIPAAFLWVGIPSKTKGPIKTGVTFSQTYAKELNINWREALTTSLDDLGIRHFRIPVYWSVVQPTKDAYDWTSIDYQLDEIGRRQGKVILGVGLKLPRWPECWIPYWAKGLSTAEEQRARLQYITDTVNRYKDHPTLSSWQVENEAEFDFGICPKASHEFFLREIQLVRSLDPAHPIDTTDSGELSIWASVGSRVDRLGVSVYRIVRNPWGGIWTYDWIIPPYWYARKALLVFPWVKKVYISEFQMEPWVKTSILKTPVQEQFETFTLERMQKNFDFAERMQLDEINFWGVEWWWWMKTQQNDARFWNEAKEFFKNGKSY